jgi:hypothetical protein
MPPIPMWSRMDDGWNSYRFLARNYVSFLGGMQPKSIEALNGEVTVWFSFGHVSIIHWARVVRRFHASFSRGFSV